jgi:hypothetical protein
MFGIAETVYAIRRKTTSYRNSTGGLVVIPVTVVALRARDGAASQQEER